MLDLKEKIKSKLESFKIRYSLMLLVILGSLFTLTVFPAILTGKFSQLPPEDLDKIVLYLIEILKIALGYLVGRGFRLVFKT